MTAEAKRSGLTVEEYERHAIGTDKLSADMDTPLLGLVGEVGSLLSALKKKRRDTDAYFGYEAAVLEELGDVLWYISAVGRRGGTSLVEICERARQTPPAEAPVHFQDLESPRIPEGIAGSEGTFERSALDLASETGDLVKRFTEGAYRNNVDALRGDLIKVIRPLVTASIAVEVSLERAARENMAKRESHWPIKREGRWPPLCDFPALFDSDPKLPEDERLPRLIRMEVYERSVNGKIFAFQKCNGILIGDRLTDNHEPPDDYRFHDVFHLAYAAVLGWSPVTRALFRVKRKSLPKKDENEDGARAILIEEGVTTWIFETARQHHFFGNTDQLGFDLLKAVTGFVRGYEPAELPMWLWEKAILEGYAAFRKLQEHRRGLIVADMERRTLVFERL